MTALLTDNLPLLAGAPNGIKKLRELILELAVRGKLVPQDPNDEPASELLKRIAEQKARLVEKGEIKKQKPMAAIAEEEKPYDLPDSWAWVRLPEIYYSVSVSGNKLLSSQISEEGIFPVVDQGKKFVSGFTDDESLLIRLPGPVVVFGDHTTERKYVDFDFVAGADGVKILRPVLLDEKFFWWHLVGLKLEGRGYARHFKVLNDAFFALPPKGEQSRIVAKVDELMALCDRLEARQADADSAHAQLVQALLDSLTQARDAEDFAQSWQRLAEHFQTLFTTESSIDALKQTLLQLAVMGKLVPQDPSDEPASELLSRIAEEKARLVTEGKLKKQKLLDEIDEKEQTFNLPDDWEWVRLGSLSQVKGGKRLPAGATFSSSRTPHVYIQVTNMKGGTIIDENLKYIDEVTQAAIKQYTISKDDIYITIAGTIGEVGTVPERFDKMNLTENAAKIVFQRINKYWLQRALSSQFAQRQFSDNTNQLAQPKLALHRIADAVLALPPLEEQHRIVAKVDQLMSLCDQLKARLNQARQVHEQLANALVEQAMA
ncbi:restriction endonuclease subunit S [Pseudomonas sp. p1(2021b)]|uniref:restriction endonuclease subunit S n=1 Tax=Pseudomonas sp. p1(2021b) TaxID=2874628 RepID=UPI001CC9B4A0|nr:restriction endonuclease subunit S [Pseudomonas sp. p1(2021b)]UBM25968.1 restriction endonuclease subunit S [Pseudomonas sp. p1(2021b)]